MEKIELIKLLNTPQIHNNICVVYRCTLDQLEKNFEEIDEKMMVSYAKAFMVYEFEKISNEYDRNRYIRNIKQGRVYDRIEKFIKHINGTVACIGEHVNKKVIYDILELRNYRDTEIYKILSTDNRTISRIIAEYHGFHSIKYFKRRAEENEGVKSYFEHIISEKELKIIEATKEYNVFNQIGHLLFDDKNDFFYFYDHNIYSDDEQLKKLIVNTNEHNPKFDIVFPDNKIVEYHLGEIRIKPYTFKQLVEYTKLYLAKHYNEMQETYEESNQLIIIGSTTNNKRKGREMIINSFIPVKKMFEEYEEIYTQKMINDCKKELIMLKESSKKYHL